MAKLYWPKKDKVKFGLFRGKWSDEEDSKLLKLVQEKGKKWAEIA